MKKILLSLSMAAISLFGYAADAFENEATTVAWAIGNESNATSITEAVASVVQETGVKVGTDLTVSTWDASGLDGGELPTYQPATSNAGSVAGDMIEYTIKMKKGLTFTPTSFVFDAVKQGTDNAFFSWSYTIDGVESEISAYSDPKNQVLRNNGANKDVAPLTHNESVSVENGGRVVTLRFYISNVANNKKMSIGNIQINGNVNGTEEPRAFKNFAIDFRTNPYTMVEPETLPENVQVNAGNYHGDQHGTQNAVVTVTVDGPVSFYVGGCNYTNGATVKDSEGKVLATMNTQAAGCDNSYPQAVTHFAKWTYNVEAAATLTFELGNYCPYFKAEATDFIPSVNVTYYDTDGKTIIGTTEVSGGSELAYAFSANDVTVADGYAFRGWFSSDQTTAVKVAEGIGLTEDLNLYAKATPIEEATSTARYIYDLTKAYWYVEDHECIEIDGKYYNNHGWLVDQNGAIRIKVSDKAIIAIKNCLYSNGNAEAIVKDAEGKEITTLPVQGESDGAETSFRYEGGATTLSITYPNGCYCHGVSVFNVVDFVTFDEKTGYYMIPANDVNSFILALTEANGSGNKNIFLPNGTYDLGETVLTSISGSNISIIGESTDGTIIVNAPAVENEGIGTTATLVNTSSNLYLQDLTIQNALDYYKSGAAGRAVCLQDKGANTVCKNVKMLSYQDTYYSNKASNFYWEDSEIHGTVDYLCGDGTVVYNRVKLVNESRSANDASGSDVVAAPNTTEGQKGYIFLDCSIESKCKDFTFARSWGGKSAAIYIRTTVLDNSLNASRWTAAGMNVAAYKFKEYKTMDKDGNVTTPATNIVNFTHSTGNLSYETVLSDDEAAEYTIANIYGTWAPDAIAAQLSTTVTKEDGKITWTATEGATAYAIVVNDQIIEIVPATTLEYADATASVRVANGRGGFGEVCEGEEATGVRAIETTKTENNRVFDLSGRRANQTAGLQIVNNQIILVK